MHLLWQQDETRADVRRHAALPSGLFFVEKHRARVLAVVAEQPDLTLVETVVELRKQRIRTSRSSLWRFLDRHGVTLKKCIARPSARSLCG